MLRFVLTSDVCLRCSLVTATATSWLPEHACILVAELLVGSATLGLREPRILIRLSQIHALLAGCARKVTFVFGANPVPLWCWMTARQMG